jgi:hypothetical protein
MDQVIDTTTATATIRDKISPHLVAMLAIALAHWAARSTLAALHPMPSALGHRRCADAGVGSLHRRAQACLLADHRHTGSG